MAENKHKEDVSKNREAGLRGFFRAAPVGCGLVRDRILLEVNDRVCEMVGYCAEELIGKDARLVYPTQAEYEYVGREKYAQIRAKGIGTVQTRWLRKDGGIIDVLLSSTAFDPNDLSKGFIFTALDITARRKAEEALRESESRYRSTIDSMDEALHVVDKDLKIVLANKTCERWCKEFGFETEVVGHSVFELFPFLPEKVREEYLQVFDTAKLLVVEEITKLGDREIITETSKIPVIESSEVVRVITIIRDVTERRRREKQIEQYQERLKAMGLELMMVEELERRRLAVGLHDGVGQKLALAKLKVQSTRELVTDGESAGSLDEILESINDAITDVRSLTFELASPVLYELGLAAAVQQHLRDKVEGKHGIAYSLIADDEMKDLDTEISIGLFRVIRELLVNVVKHAKAHSVEVSIERLNDNVQVRVKDDGVGFNAPSYSSLLRGDKACFGLFSMNERLRQLGGELKIESSPGSGTCVTICAPMRGKPVEAK